MTTENLKLALTSQEDWGAGAKKFKEFVEELAGADGLSNMQLIDSAIGNIQKTLDAIDQHLSTL